MVDRFVSVPMTLNDLERQDTMDHFFFRRILITLVSFDLEGPNSENSRHGKGRISRGQPLPQLDGP